MLLEIRRSPIPLELSDDPSQEEADLHYSRGYRDGLRDGLQWVIEQAFSPSHELDLRMAMRRVEDTGRLLGEADGAG